MKRANILITLLCAALAFGAPLFAQDALESDMERIAEDARKQAEASAQSPEASAAPAEPAAPESTVEEPEQKAKGMPMSEPPKRFFEIGVDVSGGVANNGLGFSDLFRKEIVLDIPEIQKKVGENGMIAALSPLVNGFLNINIGEFLGIGVFAKMEGDINFTLGSALLDFLANGNGEKHDMSGEAVSVAGGIFMETGLRGFLHLDRWTFTASPAAFVPLVYIPKSTLKYSLNTSNNFKLSVDGKIDVYTPFSLKEGDYAQIADMSHAGFDLTIGAEYGLFDWLYVGGTANNIPIIPSTLTHRMTIKADDLSIGLGDNPLSDPKMETNMEVGDPEYVTDANQSVSRPLTFDVYAKWQVLDMRFLKFVLKPNIGFTALTASGDPNFNWGIQADTSLLFLSFQLGTGLNQGVWKHRAGIGINLRILEILAEASLQSTDFLGSFNASGLGIGVGFRFGF
ncbi:MAG: hypothetical protein LBF87_04325 [Treponema sp.]|jgi:hypothetical protein|nr:hypothetical protein [Treponema sp.]